MNKSKTRIIATLVLIVFLSASALSSSIGTAQAADYQKTYAFLAVTPNPAGVGQSVYVIMFLSNLQFSASGNGGARFHNYTCTITKPDGTIEVKGPYTADAVSNGGLIYTPTMVGTYTLVFNYPGEFTPATRGPTGSFSPDTTFSASQSAPVTLVVQQNQIPTLIGNPAPTGYWTRPINGQNYLWGSQTNTWLMAAWDQMGRQFDQGSCYVPYGTAPNSPHVLWTKPLTFGGIVGGEFGNAQFGDGRSYEQFFRPPVIISGRLYYNEIGPEEPWTFNAFSGSFANTSTIVCVDLKDGSTLFTVPNATLSFGQVYNYVSPNQAGGMAYLWEVRAVFNKDSLTAQPYQTWRMFDAWTGKYMLTINNVPAGTILLDNTFYGGSKAGPGDVLVYRVDPAAQTLTIWNSSKTIPTLANWPNATSVGTNAWQWRPTNLIGSTLNAVGSSTVTLQNYNATPTINTDGRQAIVNLQDFPVGGSIRQIGYDNTIYVANGTAPATLQFAFPFVSTWVGYSMVDGHKLWGPTTIDLTSQMPQNATGYLTSALSGAYQIDINGIWNIWCKETAQYFAWNVKTGQFLYKTDALTTGGFVLYNWESHAQTPDGFLYNWGFDGYVHAYDTATGKLLWEFSTGPAGTNTPYGTYPCYNGITIMDGKLFTQTSDHGNGVEPLYQGEGLYALDYKTGQQLWNITGWWEQPVISDGKYIAHNCYDNQIYCFGKGPSAVTVTASATRGSAVEVQGTVSDISPAAKQAVADSRLTMVPLVSDASQNVFMNYLYQQQQMPTNVQGVPVQLTAVAPDGSTVDIGIVTSDASGYFSTLWTPQAEGQYQITATFAGSQSYYQSSAKTAFGSVVPPTTAPTPTPAPTASQVSAETFYAFAAIIIVLIIIVLLVLVLRKK
jgi:hypothetical protein